MKVVAIIQARMGSTRLPDKALLDLAGEPMLARVVNRTSRAASLDDVVVATTIEARDDVIAKHCAKREWHCFRGEEHDVLDRYYRAAIAYKADVIVRITSDCPLIEPEIIDEVARALLNGYPDVDYACNHLPQRTFPHGLDLQVLRFDILERICQADINPASREHVISYIDDHQELFDIRTVSSPVAYSHMRWTVDTPDDLVFVRKIYEHFGHDVFTWQEVLCVLEAHPGWMEINQ